MITQETIDEVTRRLVEVYDPMEIYLFGSYAWGSPTEDSDMDLLVVVKESNEPRWQRANPGAKALWGVGVSKDLLIYTKAEFERAVEHPSTLARKVKQEGVLLYAAA